MSSATKPLFVVIGSTGAQGLGVCHSLLADGKYRVRALTRNPVSERAKALSEAGAEVVKSAFNGAEALYLVTDAWDELNRGNCQVEAEQGITLVNCAVESGIKQIFFSNGPTFQHDIPMIRVCVLDADNDVGPVVVGILNAKNPEHYAGKPIVISSEDLTFPQMAEIYSKDGNYDYITPEWTEMAKDMCEDDYISARTYYSLAKRLPGHHLEPAKELAGAGSLTTFETWLRKTGFNVFDPVWRAKFSSAPWNGY
ncbi:hypothetical protein P7C73_g1159, partial [Tremellales sp. Uapishka_1]